MLTPAAEKKSARAAAPALAERLNHECFCVTLDRAALSRHLDAEVGIAGFAAALASSHPSLFSNVPVFVSPVTMLAMEHVVAAVEAAAQLSDFQAAAMAWAPAIALADFGPMGALMGYDFHITADGPRLIEVNTNAGGAFLNRRSIFKELVAAFGRQRVDAIRKTDVLRWRDSWAARPGAFNRTIPILSVMMGYAEQLGLRPRGSNPCKGTPRYKRKLVERFLSAREFHRLAASLRAFEESDPLAVHAIRLLIYTGARHVEIVGLRWEWVQPPRLMLPDSKTGAKIIYLNRQAFAVLDGLPTKAEAGFVFPSTQGDKPIGLSVPWQAIRRHAALPDVRLHDLRHSFASVAIADGISLVVIGKLLGHALAETTERYAHLADEAIADAAKRVSGSLASCLGIAA